MLKLLFHVNHLLSQIKIPRYLSKEFVLGIESQPVFVGLASREVLNDKLGQEGTRHPFIFVAISVVVRPITFRDSTWHLLEWHLPLLTRILNFLAFLKLSFEAEERVLNFLVDQQPVYFLFEGII